MPMRRLLIRERDGWIVSGADDVPIRPMLDCPTCGEPLIAAHGRGRFDEDGNIIAHRTACRCRWCNWIWYDDEPPVDCSCGARVGVDVDDGSAFAVEVGP